MSSATFTFGRFNAPTEGGHGKLISAVQQHADSPRHTLPRMGAFGPRGRLAGRRTGERPRGDVAGIPLPKHHPRPQELQRWRLRAHANQTEITAYMVDGMHVPASGIGSLIVFSGLDEVY